MKPNSFESKKWKKIDSSKFNFNEGGFLGLEEIDGSDYIVSGSSSNTETTTPTPAITKTKTKTPTKDIKKVIKKDIKKDIKTDIKKDIKKDNKKNSNSNKKVPLKNNKRNLDKFLDDATKKGNENKKLPKISDFDDHDDDKVRETKKPKFIKMDNSIQDLSQTFKNDFKEGTFIKNKKKTSNKNNINQVEDDEDMYKNYPVKKKVEIKQEKIEIKKVNINNNVDVSMEVEEEEEEEEQVSSDDQYEDAKEELDVDMDEIIEQVENKEEVKEDDEVKEIKVKKVKEQTKKSKINQRKADNIQKRKEISELKTVADDQLSNIDMSEWSEFKMEPVIIDALRTLGFSKPTPIQASVIPNALLKGHDIIGAAETGSGKTLAFGIPIVSRIIQHLKKNNQPFEKKQLHVKKEEVEEGGVKIKEEKLDDEDEVEEEESNERSNEFRKLFALVVCPTRELAIQVSNHFKAIIKFTNFKVATIVGGMASQRQERLLSKCPEIVVATPGRLWELISEDQVEHLTDLSSLLCLAIDEADRMIEKGHFMELESLLERLPTPIINKSKKKTLKQQREQFSKKKLRKFDKDDEEFEDGNDNDDQLLEEMESENIDDRIYTKHKRQTFIFSATLVNIKSQEKKIKQANSKLTGRKGQVQALSPMDELINKVKFQRDYKLVDCTNSKLTASNLTETKIYCSLEDKDVYLYYFIEKYPGRTLVFVNSIDSTRRLIPILQALKIPVFPLHAQMQQKQRLKNLDRFRTLDNVVLLATDVAARGLDIPLVQHVIHYHIPKSTELYIHRSGRTARSNHNGLSVMLVSPNEKHSYNVLDSDLDHSIENFPVNLSQLRFIQERVRLSREIDKLTYSTTKKQKEENWFKKTATEMGLESDSDDEKESEDEMSAIKDLKQNHKVNSLKLQLNNLLKSKVNHLKPGVSPRYIATIANNFDYNNHSATDDFNSKQLKKIKTFKK